jgi:hypothetical protein
VEFDIFTMNADGTNIQGVIKNAGNCPLDGNRVTPFLLAQTGEKAVASVSWTRLAYHDARRFAGLRRLSKSRRGVMKSLTVNQSPQPPEKNCGIEHEGRDQQWLLNV